MEVLQGKVNKYSKVIEDIEKDLAEIKSIAHTPVNNLTDRLSKLENKARF